MTAREPRRQRAGRRETPGDTQLSGRASRARANAQTASGPSPAQVVRPQVAEVERERFEAEALGQVVGQAGRERLDGAPHEAPPGLASGCPIAYGEQRGRDAARGEHGSESAGEEGLERGRWVRTQTHGAPSATASGRGLWSRAGGRGRSLPLVWWLAAMARTSRSRTESRCGGPPRCVSARSRPSLGSRRRSQPSGPARSPRADRHRRSSRSRRPGGSGRGQ